MHDGVEQVKRDAIFARASEHKEEKEGRFPLRL